MRRARGGGEAAWAYADPAWRYKGAFIDDANHYGACALEASPDGVHWHRQQDRLD
jgi:hypothetical protein